MFKRIKAIIKKELYHILRDPRTLAVIFAMPVMMVLLYGYALNMDIKFIPIGFIDYDHSAESRALIQDFDASEYFNIKEFAENYTTIDYQLELGIIKAAIIIPKGFGENRKKQPVSQIQLLVDGSDPTYGNAVVNYANALVTLHSSENQNSLKMIPINFSDRFLYNPDLKGAHFIIPGLVAVIMMMVCALLTSITISREKETGTMEVLLVSPVRPIEIIAAKVIPYVVLSIIDGIFILIFAKLVFDIPLRGDLVLLLGLSILFIYCALSIGLLISSMASTQQIAMMAALVATILPSIILSGFIFPIFSMPAPIRALTAIVPAKYYMIIIRGILLKASSFRVVQTQAISLVLLGTIFLLIATIRFKTRAQ
ncbi:MAG: ABC transporter permease [Candidatus Latescibacteria bacterium]|nr:ABC transporter permease [Candidatus Latescibacterota bacterium]